MSPSRRAFLAFNGAALGATLLPRGLLAAVESRSPPMPRLDDWAKVLALFDEASIATVGGIVSRVREAVRPATRVLGITWVHSSTGMRLPVRQIADALQDVNRGRSEIDRVLLVVDGVHGLGAADDGVA